MSEILLPTKKSLQTAYNEADAAGKRLLANLYGAGLFAPREKEDFRTFKDVCDAAGRNMSDFVVPKGSTNRACATIYLNMLLLVAKTLNGDWKPNLADTGQYKYYPWFKILPDNSKPSGFGLSYDDYVCAYSGSTLGARPYFKDRETAIYAGQQFIDLFENWAQYDAAAMNE